MRNNLTNYSCKIDWKKRVKQTLFSAEVEGTLA